MLRMMSIAGVLLFAVPVAAQNSTDPSKELDAAIAADWPKFDHNGKGHLTQEEFATWLTTLRAQSKGTSEDPIKVRAWADTSFAMADTDANKEVSPEEFTAFLQSKMKK